MNLPEGKISLVVALAGVVLSLLFFASNNLSSADPSGSSGIIKIKAPVPQLPYVSNRSFYLLVNSGEGEQLIRLDLAFHFRGINQQECFERNDRIFRDMVYRLLKDQHPQKNTVKEWNTILRDHIAQQLTVLPGRCRIADIVAESIQRF
ncbi:MAG: hypothetical protein ACP5TY_07305 [Thermodesulforhabdaceae bacterium]|jgi:flagellar basal body-associated protein FliL